MRKMKVIGLCGLLAVALAGCESRTDQVDGGGVLLSVSDYDGIPITVSVNDSVAASAVQLGSITIQNVAKRQGAATSELMNVELQSYEVVFSRLDGGTRVPPPYVRGIFGVVPVNGTAQYENWPIMGLEQLTNAPLTDLQFFNGAVDRETGLAVITLNVRLRYFGRTLSGDAVDTAPINFSLQFVP